MGNGDYSDSLRQVENLEPIAEAPMVSFLFPSHFPPVDDDVSPIANLNDQKLADFAAHCIRERERRKRYFNADLFGEPIWDILLDLFISTAFGKPTTVKSSTIASGVPQTTALRYLNLLEERGIVERSASPNDGRAVILRLTYPAMAAMREYLRHQTSPPSLK